MVISGLINPCLWDLQTTLGHSISSTAMANPRSWWDSGQKKDYLAVHPTGDWNLERGNQKTANSKVGAQRSSGIGPGGHQGPQPVPSLVPTLLPWASETPPLPLHPGSLRTPCEVTNDHILVPNWGRTWEVTRNKAQVTLCCPQYPQKCNGPWISYDFNLHFPVTNGVKHLFIFLLVIKISTSITALHFC